MPSKPGEFAWDQLTPWQQSLLVGFIQTENYDESQAYQRPASSSPAPSTTNCKDGVCRTPRPPAKVANKRGKARTK